MNGKTLRNTLVTGLLFLCASPAITRAQSGGQDSGQNEAAPAQNAPAGPNLNLTDDQQAQVKKVHQDAKSQINAVENDTSLGAEQKQEKIRQIHRAARKQVEAILTPSQKETMKEWRIAHKQARPQ